MRKHKHIKRMACLLVGMVGALMLGGLRATPALAHGEAAQPAFLKEGTIAFWDVKFSSNTIKMGQDLTITGKVRFLEGWPNNLADPSLVWLSAVAQGPRVLVMERYINDQFTPSSWVVEKGNNYTFKEVLRGRSPGTYHVHPMMATKGAGPIIGPGQYVTVVDTGAEFANNVNLLSGETIDLETYGRGTVISWHLIVVLVAVPWLLFWLLRPLVIRAKYVGTGAEAERRLVSKRDRMIGYGIGAVMIVVLLIGNLITSNSYSVTIPQQTIRIAPPALPPSPQLASLDPYTTTVTYGPTTQTVLATLKVTNTGHSPVILDRFATASYEFANQATHPNAQNPFTVDNPNPIAPGETRKLQVTMADAVWQTDNLIPINEVQLILRGVFLFRDSTGTEAPVEINAPINVDYKVLLEHGNARLPQLHTNQF
jgi:methane/ammonia monooxygenase subunit B